MSVLAHGEVYIVHLVGCLDHLGAVAVYHAPQLQLVITD